MQGIHERKVHGGAYPYDTSHLVSHVKFVAMGRVVNKYEVPGDDLDDFVDAIGRFENLSRMGFDCGSVKRTVGDVGPLFGTRLLNWECLE